MDLRLHDERLDTSNHFFTVLLPSWAARNTVVTEASAVSVSSRGTTGSYPDPSGAESCDDSIRRGMTYVVALSHQDHS